MSRHLLATFSISLVLVVGAASFNLYNNVCENIEDYAIRWINPRCWHSTDVWADTATISAIHGYHAQSYKVVTEDGYVLTTYRLKNENGNSSVQRQPIFLQHGASLDSASWVLVGNRSLPFQLVDGNYDVWLGNTRGTKYSIEHVSKPFDSKEYWDFSLDEISKYDVSANLNLVAKETGLAGKIIYVGHSMGGTLGTIHGIVKKEEAEALLAGYVFLAPVIYFKNPKTIWPLLVTIFPYVKIVLNSLGLYGLYQYRLLHIIFAKFVCGLSPLQYRFCRALVFLVFGSGTSQLEDKTLPIFFANWPEALSTNTINHYSQLARYGELQMYNYGKAINLETYGRSDPPVYNTSKIDLPVYIYRVENDPVSTLENLEDFYERIQSTSKFLQLVPSDGSLKFAHLDFLYGKNAEEYIYKPLIDMLSERFSINT